ncbi:MAG: hypothetical protein ACW987_18340 [Candidatus Thorarchaeota archaeon]|jgi:hypothetical protein
MSTTTIGIPAEYYTAPANVRPCTENGVFVLGIVLIIFWIVSTRR